MALDPVVRVTYARVMRTWSYKRLTMEILDIEKPEFEGRLDVLGQDGWELVSSFDREKGGYSKEVYFIFKRLKKE